MSAPARRAALAALRAIETGRSTLPAALAHLRGRLADHRDAALAAEIVVGTLRWRLTLDHELAGYSTRSLDRVDPVLVDLLRLSLYQLRYLDRVPAAAVVNDAVTLAREARGPRAAGFVNAVLRRAAAVPGAPPQPPEPAPSDTRGWVEYLSLRHSHPPWLVERWVGRLGVRATEARLRHHQSPAPVDLRVNRWRADVDTVRDRLAAAGIVTEPSPWLPDGLRVRHGNPTRTPVVADGLAVVQDEGSQLVAAFLGAEPGERVLDVCAAPGGKATAISCDVGAHGLVVAGDHRSGRVALLRRTVRSSGAPNILLVRHDARSGLPFGPVFDRVIVDAPCSGLGMLRRDPDIKWRRIPADFDRLVHEQRRLLAEAARVVRPGGLLLYATCSTEPEENEEVAAWFARAHPAFARQWPAGRWRQPPLSSLVTADGALAIVPERHGLDGYFAVRFRRG